MSTTLEKPIAGRPIADTARKNLSICVLDDEADHVELTMARLEKAGFSLVGTTNPQEALQKVGQGGCRVVLADFKMPGMEGLKFLEKTLQQDPGIYVILITGYYSVDAAIDAVKRGAYDYLCKPIDFPRLEKTLDELAQLFSQRGEIASSSRTCFGICSSTESSGEARRCWKSLSWPKRWRGTIPTC